MKNIAELNANKVPLVIIDPELNKLRDVELFPAKVEKARQTIARLGLPTRALNSEKRAGG